MIVDRKQRPLDAIVMTNGTEGTTAALVADPPGATAGLSEGVLSEN